MNNFYLEIPSIKRKEDIIDYINELEQYNSEINGIELLAKILDGYSFEETLENCLKRSNKEYAIKNGKNQVNTYLLIRKSDNKIVGAINIRLNYGSGITKFNEEGIKNVVSLIKPTSMRFKKLIELGEEYKTVNSKSTINDSETKFIYTTASLKVPEVKKVTNETTKTTSFLDRLKNLIK